MNQKFKIKITKKESYALNMIKGLPQDAMYMVILTEKGEDSETLKGTQKTFESLLSTLHEEVDYRMSPRSRLPHIINVIEKIETKFYPEEDEIEIF